MNDYDVSPSKTREYPLENGNKLRMTISDPYGFITFSLEHGRLPEDMLGQYTDWHTAEITARKYIAQRQDTIAETQQKPVKKAG